MKNDEKILGAQGATEDVSAGSIASDAAPHAAAHTPGPWVWLGKPGHSALNAAHGRVLDEASYEGMWFAAYDDKIDTANAHLIAAAPEMYEALKAVMASEHSNAGGGRECCCVAHEAARAALAKAEGR